MSEMTGEQWTIKRLLDWTDNYFSKSTSGKSRLEAETLLSEAIGCTRIELYTRFDEVPQPEILSRFRSWVKRRAAGEPVAYLVGYSEFYSLRFNVDSNVLIPRPETEHVVVAALEHAKTISERPIRILDIGTGSGCIAIALAKHLEDVQIAATDLSNEALQVAARNAEIHQVTKIIRFLSGDLYDSLPHGSRPVHLIVSNPPYVGRKEIDTVDSSVRDYEPDMALFAGDHGLDLLDRLISGAPSRLLPGGCLIFESSPIIMDTCRKMIESTEGLELVEMVKDFSGHDRVLVATKR
jgi:release factor glutamine methyltransferase